MLIPYQELSEEAVYSLAKDWVVSNLSDTEYLPDVDVWSKQAVQKIKSGELVIEFGEESQTVYLKSKEDINFEQAEVRDLNE